jgi:hypothetical protein
MSKVWEDRFESWGSPPGQTEKTKCENAVRMVREAIAASYALAGKDVDVFLQGSYANRTNVHAESDVDTTVRCKKTLYYELPEYVTAALRGIGPVVYPFDQFRADLGAALIAHFGAGAKTLTASPLTRFQFWSIETTDQTLLPPFLLRVAEPDLLRLCVLVERRRLRQCDQRAADRRAGRDAR